MDVKLGLLILRKDHRLRKFTNRVPRIFKPKRDEVITDKSVQAVSKRALQ
jgi:hypothetical protein